MALIKFKHYTEETILTWDELLGIECEKKHRSNFEEKGKETEWIFKGHKISEWELRSTFEREIGNMGIDRTKLPSKCKNSEANLEYNKEFDKAISNCLKNGLNGLSVYELEDGLIRKFQRQFYHHDLRSPKDRNIVEWLALMRHYGAPVRLLDWTYSFYVALFFAIEEAEGDCAVWALNKKYLINRVLGKNGEVSDMPEEKKINLLYDQNVERLKTWKSVFAERPFPFVFPLNPFRLNERLVIQQGDFLCPGDISKPFEENLAAVLPAEVNEGSDYKLYKYVIKFNVEERRESLLNLHRMNINRATLFPGLEGFAQSLKTLLVSPVNLLKS